MRVIFSQSLFKVFVLCLFLSGSSAVVYAEPYETIVNNGSPQNRIDIAILGDGYTSAEMPKYRADVERIVSGIFAEVPYSEYRNFYNVHRIDVVSRESGADHPDRFVPTYVDTALDATYGCLGTPQLICIDNSKVIEIINQTLPASHCDVIVVLINDIQFGGSGGFTAVSSTGGSTFQSVGVILHEIGHTFALLGDEYIGYETCNTDGGEPYEVNITRETERDKIKWKHWIEPSTPIPTLSGAPAIPGLYQGARYCDNLYRPTSFSRMRNNYSPFEQINTEQHVKRIYNFVSPIDDSSPAGNSVVINSNQAQTFSVATPQPFTHSLNVIWLVDGQQRGSGASFILNGGTLASGTHTVRAVVSDPTPFVRNDPQQLLSENRDWIISVQAVAQRTLFDFDGDGKADQAVFRPSDRVWYLLRSSSGFTAAQFGVSTDKITPADFDGDGKTDIAVFRDGFWYWLNSSNGSFQGVQFGQVGDIPVPFDYTGDGRAELAVYRSGFWYLLNLANNQFQAVQFGVTSDKPVAADYDGDGKTDIAVVRQAGGASIWYILGSTQGFYGLQFGTDTDKSVPADYDGDGKTDVAVYRNGIWYILGSTQGFYAVQFGIASDIPVAADYDGDGKTDIAVYRDGIWYMLRSQQGFGAVKFGFTTDKPIPEAYVP